MAKEICISTTPHETRLAILEDDQLAEIYYERENEYTLAGSIYKGRVTRVLPGMQSSFVDVGLERDAFLYVTDFLEEQEDSDEYASDGNGGARRETRVEQGEEPQGAAAGTDRSDRNGGERNGGRGSERHQERNAERGGGPDRSPERNPDRGGRRPAAAAPQPSEATREPAREGGRAGRERAREQAIAPLREAVPAAQDLDEKGDEESPEGTRRWRGRRGRRRGVRGGLPASRPLLSDSPQALEEASTAEEAAAAPFSIVEHGAPGGVIALPAIEQDPARRNDAGRDRGSRRSREPYAQVSTFDRPAREPGQPGREPRSEGAGLPQGNGLPPASGAIVLPGESLSKYGSAPADPSVTPAAATATVPRAVRPVNYVAPKPSTLVELPADWDGGAVLPGETLSRYRGAQGAEPVPDTPSQATAHAAAPQPDLDRSDEPVAEPVVEPVQDPHQHLDHDPLPTLQEQEARSSLDPDPVYHADAPHEAVAGYAPVVEAESATEPDLAEPEIVAAAVSPADQAPEPQIAEPVMAHQPEPAEGHAAEEPGWHAMPESASSESPEQAAQPERTEPVEYEPENASASYRVQPTGPSELRLAGPEVLEEEDSEIASEANPSHASLGEATSYGEPEGQLAGTEGAPLPQQFGHAPTHTEVAEFAGTLADAEPSHAEPAYEQSFAPTYEQSIEAGPEPKAAPHAEPPTALLNEPLPWPAAQTAAPLQILHADGTVDLAAAQEPAADIPASSAPRAESSRPAAEPAAWSFDEQDFEVKLSPAAEAQQREAEQGFTQAESSADSATPFAPTPFSDMVERMQGFAPGNGLLEEETIDEEEYDFEPLHAHADEGDQEDLEEETLDQQMEPSALSDAVRESHLEQRVQHVQQAPETAAFLIEEGEETFGYEQMEEGEEFDEEEEGEEPARAAQTGEPQRAGRPDEGRRLGRSGGRSGGRNGGRLGGGRNGGRGRSAQTQSLPIISELLKQGQEILVQIAKEPIAKKGARITSHIALPGRFLVFMPTVSHVGVSRKIASDEERQRLKRILISEKGESSGGFIVRTAAEGSSEEDLRADLRFLISLWTEIKQRSDTAKAPALIYHDLNLIERILRDQVSSNFSTIWVDSEAEYERIIRFLSRFQPGLVRRVKLYTKETPLFEHFGIQEEISKALKSKVWLKSGGSIVINQTEALVAIDINTGKYVGKTSRLEDTIVKTNLDAIPEIVRQIRLRDLGGIIVIDFIDMDERKNRNRVLAALEEELKNDRAPSKVLQFNDFGLVAITRKRVKQSLERTLSVTCETCTGTGMVKSPITVCNEIYTEMRKMMKHLDGKDVMLRVHPEVVKQLKAGNGKWINELEEMVAKTIIIKSDPALHPEQFDIH